MRNYGILLNKFWVSSDIIYFQIELFLTHNLYFWEILKFDTVLCWNLGFMILCWTNGSIMFWNILFQRLTRVSYIYWLVSVITCNTFVKFCLLCVWVWECVRVRVYIVLFISIYICCFFYILNISFCLKFHSAVCQIYKIKLNILITIMTYCLL